MRGVILAAINIFAMFLILIYVSYYRPCLQVSECDGNWTVIVNTTLESAFEQTSKNEKITDAKYMMDAFRKKHILILSCKQNGKLYKSVEVNP